MMGTTSVACHSQNAPADRRVMIVPDDAGELQNDSCGGWQIKSIPRRFRSLFVYSSYNGRFHASLSFRREIFCWVQAKAYHGQAFMEGTESEVWYDRGQAGAFKVTWVFPPGLIFRAFSDHLQRHTLDRF